MKRYRLHVRVSYEVEMVVDAGDELEAGDIASAVVEDAAPEEMILDGVTLRQSAIDVVDGEPI